MWIEIKTGDFMDVTINECGLAKSWKETRVPSQTDFRPAKRGEHLNVMHQERNPCNHNDCTGPNAYQVASLFAAKRFYDAENSHCQSTQNRHNVDYNAHNPLR